MSDLLEAVTELGTGVLVGATLAPGFLLCIPGLTLAALVILAPLVALALVVLVAALVVMPFVAGAFLLKRWATSVKLAMPTAVSGPSDLDLVTDGVFGSQGDAPEARIPLGSGLISAG
jgi:hypothetical protein